MGYEEYTYKWESGLLEIWEDVINVLFHRIWLYKNSKVLLSSVAFCNKFVSNIDVCTFMKATDLIRLLFIVARNHVLRCCTIKNEPSGVQKVTGFMSKRQRALHWASFLVGFLTILSNPFFKTVYLIACQSSSKTVCFSFQIDYMNFISIYVSSGFLCLLTNIRD